MTAPLYSSPALHLTSDICVDVRADAEGVTLGAQSDGSLMVDLHCAPEQALLAAEYLIEGAQACFLAREG